MEDRMRHQTLFIFVVSIVVLFVLEFAHLAAAQVTVQKPVEKPEETVKFEVDNRDGGFGWKQGDRPRSWR
jgi:hypothetical protein